MSRSIAATDLRRGESVPTGVPIHCCGVAMGAFPDLGGNGCDRQCASCHRVVVIWNGRVELIDIIRR